MILSRRRSTAGLLGSLLLTVALGTDAVASPNVPARAIDLDLKAAEVTNVFKVLQPIAGKTIVLDPCVQGKLDLRLRNTPLPIVFDALAAKLGLVYTERGDELHVTCVTQTATSAASRTLPFVPPPPAVRVSLVERDAPMDDVVAKLAGAMSLKVEYRATAHPRVTITLEHVRAPTAVTALGDTSGLQLTVMNGATLLVTDRPASNEMK